MLLWEMQFFCWPSFFLHRNVREARSVTRDSTLTYSDRSGDACPRVREPKTFNGCSNDFKEWTFAVELGLWANRIVKKDHEVDYATSYLGGNALLWLISCSESGRKFADWTSLKIALDESFGPLGADEDNRLQIFSLTQNGPLDEYIKEFSRLSLMVSGLDDQSRALLFVRGLSASLRYEAMREHPQPCPKRCALPEWHIGRFLWLAGMTNGKIVRVLVTDDLLAGI